MFKAFFKFWFRLAGWKIKGGIPPEIKKCVLVAAPHTSNWDFVWGMGALAEFNYDVKYLAKKELFRFPIKGMLLKLGGMPVDRSKHNRLTDAIVDLFNQYEKLIVLFPPEGTRSAVSKWKTGFYHVAVQAKVPILLGYLDYKNKIAAIDKVLYPSGDMQLDFQEISNFYKNVHPKIPKNFSLPNIDEIMK
ncbi:MAG: 1-acyl-sn-glycerol-3-phosphate acyltransferase [Bacteroidia bacterium]